MLLKKKYLLHKKKVWKPYLTCFLFTCRAHPSPSKKNIISIHWNYLPNGSLGSFPFLFSYSVFFFATLYKVVVVCFPYSPRIPIWVVWVSIFCHVFKECFLCDIFIGGNRIFCVKFPLFGLCNRRCFDFLATIWLVLIARLGRVTVLF